MKHTLCITSITSIKGMSFYVISDLSFYTVDLSCHVMSCHVMSCFRIRFLSRDMSAMSCDIICHVMSRGIKCHAMSCNIVYWLMILYHVASKQLCHTAMFECLLKKKHPLLSQTRIWLKLLCSLKVFQSSHFNSLDAIGFHVRIRSAVLEKHNSGYNHLISPTFVRLCIMQCKTQQPITRQNFTGTLHQSYRCYSNCNW